MLGIFWAEHRREAVGNYLAHPQPEKPHLIAKGLEPTLPSFQRILNDVCDPTPLIAEDLIMTAPPLLRKLRRKQREDKVNALAPKGFDPNG